MAVNVRVSVKCQLFLIILQVIYGVLPAYGLLYMGCFTDNSADRDLPNRVYYSSDNEPVKCISECSSQGYTYAGVQNKQGCYCGNSYGKYGQVDDSQCADACPANGNYKCGGWDRNSVYRVDKAPLQYLGCYEDKATRDLNGEDIMFSSTAPIFCMNYCLSKGYVFAGMQVGDQCLCGNTYGRYGQVADSDCSRACSGNKNVLCGNDWRNSVYRVDPQFDKFKGCYKDEVPHKFWLHPFALTGSVNSTTTCVTKCTSQGFPYAVVYNLTTCYCGLSYRGQAENYKECNIFCYPGSQDCSANQRFSVYETDATPSPSKPLFFSPKQSMKALSGHVIVTGKSIASVFTCISYCDVVATCKSINYDAGGQVCELNNATASEGSTVESRDGLIYYAPDNNVETLLFN